MLSDAVSLLIVSLAVVGSDEVRGSRIVDSREGYLRKKKRLQKMIEVNE